jgi:hypothetical protein
MKFLEMRTMRQLAQTRESLLRAPKTQRQLCVSMATAGLSQSGKGSGTASLAFREALVRPFVGKTQRSADMNRL